MIRKRYLVGGILVLAAVGFLLYTSLAGSVSYYLTVSEFIERSSELADRQVRVIGKVADAPISWNPESLELEFAITESRDTLSVLYEGAKPSGFKVGADILVEGMLEDDGLFHASQLLMKCPSKYLPEE